ncbi:hypothetical protein SAY87_024554 [Trapa incisa]|uniref:Late embryogenesis abundant protein LEA-2 subgroup domain-containing protein n=1 Tax=Trapa incisa TaxID=236973 RepID=A0AAN7G9U0_9MYRT|nr:hypothetical protein SAY87_024554 [Trapa incisa]
MSSGDTKNCPHHGHSGWRKKALVGLLVAILVIIVVALTVWLVLRPRKPIFVLQDATVYAFNVSSYPNLLTSTFQVTVVSRNPNSRIGIYYDKLAAYASYRGQQITLRSRIRSSYQGHKEIDIWSPFLFGFSVPIAPYNAAALSQDQANGMVVVNIELIGWLRWKVGAMATKSYHIVVKCPALIRFGSQSGGVAVGGSAVKYQIMQKCIVTI